MKLNRILLSTLGSIAGIACLAPTAAFAGGPLLSGYGGPGAGDQVILGAALIGGPSGGGSGGGGSGGGGVDAAAAGSSGAAAGSSTAGGTARGGGSGSRGASAARPRAGTATHHRAAGANPQSSTHLEGPSGVTADTAAESWFSGGDLLALALVAGLLALVAATTLRLTRTRHE